MSRLSVLALLPLLLASAGGSMTTPTAAQTQAPPDRGALERTVTVSGLGHVSAAPDVVHVTLGVVSEGDTAKTALERNTAAMEAIVAALKGRGLQPKDIQTSNFSVNPRYRQPRQGEQPSINGYQVQNTVRIVVRDIAALGAILDQVIGLGSNQVHGIAFEVSKADEIRNEARKAAMANARQKAELLAIAAGARVGRVLAIEEGGAATIVRQPKTFARAAMAPESAPPIEAGSQRLDAHVTVTYALE